MNYCSVSIVDMCGGSIQDDYDFSFFNLVLRPKLETKTSGDDNTGHAELYCYI